MDRLDCFFEDAHMDILLEAKHYFPPAAFLLSVCITVVMLVYGLYRKFWPNAPRVQWLFMAAALALATLERFSGKPVGCNDCEASYQYWNNAAPYWAYSQASVDLLIWSAAALAVFCLVLLLPETKRKWVAVGIFFLLLIINISVIKFFAPFSFSV